jgi:hypothetical protein
MKKNFHVILIVSLFLLFSFSCQKYEDDAVSDPEIFWKYEGTSANIMKVISDLKSVSGTESGLKSTGTDLRNEIKGQPLWDKGRVMLLNDVPTFLVPVKSNKWNFIKAIVAINYKTGGGNLQYLIIYRKNLKNSTNIMPREAWGGYFAALDKELLKIKNNSPGFQKNTISDSSNLKSYSCTGYVLEYCWHWGYMDNENFVETGVSCTYSYEEDCQWIDDSSSGTSSSCTTACSQECGTYDPCYCDGDCSSNTDTPSTTTQTSTADHSLPNKNNLPKNGTTDTQVGYMCVFKTMEWISIYYDKLVSTGTSLLYYCTTYNLTLQDVVTKDGVALGNLESLVSHYFNMSATTDIQESIDSGYPLMATFVNGSSGHEVMITGYNNDETIEYFDPETGYYSTTASGNFSYIYKITGVK